MTCVQIACANLTSSASLPLPMARQHPTPGGRRCVRRWIAARRAGTGRGFGRETCGTPRRLNPSSMPRKSVRYQVSSGGAPSHCAFILGSPSPTQELAGEHSPRALVSGHEHREVRVDGIAGRDVFRIWFKLKYKRRIGFSTSACFVRPLSLFTCVVHRSNTTRPLGARSFLPVRAACGQDAGQL